MLQKASGQEIIDNQARHDGAYAGKVCTGRAADMVLGARAEIQAWPGPGMATIRGGWP
jgi:hypothetical protein